MDVDFIKRERERERERERFIDAKVEMIGRRKGRKIKQRRR